MSSHMTDWINTPEGKAAHRHMIEAKMRQIEAGDDPLPPEADFDGAIPAAVIVVTAVITFLLWLAGM